MVFQDIDNLIVKYLTNEANSSDLDILSKWIAVDDNEKYFETYVKIHFEVKSAMNKPDIDSLKDTLLKKIKKDKNPYYKYRVPLIMKYAALFAVLFSVGYLYQTRYTTNLLDDTIVKQNILTPKEEAITITMDDGTIRTLNPEETDKLTDSYGNLIGNHNKSQLVYTGSSRVEKLVYNTLHIPNGKRFDLVLSDGTHVFLNSGTSIKYPIKFLKGNQRDVFITGEAYFDVVKDKDHPFIVHADEMNVRVLGTKFNISHYPEDENINTVLVEGAVELFNDTKKNKAESKSTNLRPGFKAEWSKSDGEIEIENVDTRVYTAWVDGKLIFRNTSFKRIRKTLERHYNVVIKNSSEDLDAQLFDATFDIETINEILETFSKSYAIEYSIVDNQVIIN